MVTALLAYRTAVVQHRLQEQSRRRSRQEVAEDLFRRYREPLLWSAYALQSRLFNVMTTNFLPRQLGDGDSPEQRYARDHTVYTIAEYLGWVEIVRREQRFLDIGAVPLTRELLALLNRITGILAHNRPGPFQLYRGGQRAVGELMQEYADEPTGPTRGVLGYAAFCERLDTDPRFAAWFARLRADVDFVDADDEQGSARVIELQAALIDLVQLLDPKGDRVPADMRLKLAGLGEGGPTPAA
ncbi:hypothetical protein GA0070564_101385 [Micromonospora mirobrigensis]|uniref:Uncharacterized protein n=2 Tax=Micromonospora mirobrigensis TaxID=262898 RepID=A0A1C4UCP0_9ACTN|nr:hypothetical protein GA0070564_101385 [Micromonospora mirobrigensis]